MRARELRRAPPEAERAIWQRLRHRGLGGWKFRRQHPLGPFFANFACVEGGLVVELDGGQHFEPDAMRADESRTKALGQFGFSVLRFSNLEALTETEAVRQTIAGWFATHHPHPGPLPQAGEGVKGPHPGPLPQAGEGVKGPHPNPLPQAGEGVKPRTES